MPQRYSSDLAERARQLHAEGRFGGAEFGRLGGRPRRPPASTEVIEAIELNADKIIAALEDGLGEHQPIQTRLRAVKLALEIEASCCNEAAEPTGLEHLSHEELIASIVRQASAV